MNKTQEASQTNSVHPPSLDRFGMSAKTLARYKQALEKPHGCIYASGPTGSGKTTTLYSSLIHLNDPCKKAITIESPVLGVLDGVTQVDLSEHRGDRWRSDLKRLAGDNQEDSDLFEYTPASTLRAVLKSDPDVILIGEIDGAETAELAVDAALTGHLVLSSLSISGASQFYRRLSEMGVPKFLIAESTNAVINQRLLPTLCRECRIPVQFSDNLINLEKISAADYKRVLESDAAGQMVYKKNSAGCEACFYRGQRKRNQRTAVFEVVVVDDELREAITVQAPPEELAAITRSCGGLSLFEEALKKVFAGEIDIDQAVDLSGF